MVFARTLDVGKDPQFDKTWERFINGDDTERNNTFKMIVNILKAPFTVTASLKMFGGMKPILTGNKIGQVSHNPVLRMQTRRHYFLLACKSDHICM